MAALISVKNILVGENSAFADFIVSLSEASQQEISVSYDWNSITAGSNDFSIFSGKLVFAAGVTTQTVRVAITDDNLVEGLETFALRLTNPVNAAISNPYGIAGIVDNDKMADSVNRANLSVRDVVVDATADFATFYVVLDKATNGSVTVAYSTSNGTASAGADYAASSGTVTFAAGETVKSVSVALPHDALAERAETFNLVLGAISGSSAGQVAIADGAGQATIGAHHQTTVAMPLITVNSPYVGEKDGYVDFVVSLSAPSDKEVGVGYDWNNALAGSNDFGVFSGKLVFAPGVTTQTVRITISDDTQVEGLETFALRLTSPTNAEIANPYGIAAIVDNDTMADSVNRAQLSVRDVIVDASADFATFYVVLDRATNDSFSVSYTTANGTASAGTDYVASSGSVTFGPGETVKGIMVALPHDGIAQRPEMFDLVLGTVSGNSAGQVAIADGRGQATIGLQGQTPAAMPSISVNNPFVGEHDGYVDFVLSLSAPSQNQVKVSYDWANGLGGTSDFVPFGGEVAFAPGVTTQVVRVSIDKDTIVEGLETFGLGLTNATNASIANPFGVAAIVDNDTMADTANRANLSVRDVVVDASADFVTFYVMLDKATNGSFNVAYNTSNGSAVAGIDYLSSAGTLTFGPGETVKSVSIALPHDLAAEPAETFTIQLGAVSGASAGQVAVADAIGRATIGGHGQTAVAMPAMSVNNPAVNEKDGYVDFIVTLSAPSQNQVSVSYAWGNGTGGSNDFVPFGGNLVFAPGTTTQLVRVSIRPDTITEGTETFVLRLSNAVNAVVANPVGTASIHEGALQTTVFGTAGLDTVSLSGVLENYSVTKGLEGFTVIDKTGTSAPQLLVDVERIAFSNNNLALDVDGTGGEAYRIYQAAFNRKPDASGLGFWMSAMDKGTSLTEVAKGFMQSQEFINAYGANPNNYDLVSKIYMNVLHRPAEAAGLNYWVNALDARQVSAAEALGFISESAENQVAVLPDILNGFVYTFFG